MPIVFLSPSTQEYNNYATEGNEEYYMNLLADKMIPYLQASGIEYVRNDPERAAAGAIKDSNAGYYDVHLALHTNAGGEAFAGKLRGIDIYYAPYSEDSRNLAVIIANNLQEIYPLENKSRALPTYSLGEVLRTKAVAVLAEIGYHDNIEDEEWLKSNLDNIAENLVRSLCDYFGIPFINAEGIKRGIVVTDGYSNLNIRAYPSFDAEVVGRIPSDTEILIYGETQGENSIWYTVDYSGVTGYVNGNFIEII